MSPVRPAPLDEPVEQSGAETTVPVISRNHHGQLDNPGRNKLNGRGRDNAGTRDIADEHRRVLRCHQVLQPGGGADFVNRRFRTDPSLLLGDGDAELDSGVDVLEAGTADRDIGGVRGADRDWLQQGGEDVLVQQRVLDAAQDQLGADGGQVDSVGDPRT
nr:hypothetical protein [Nocardia albiluteola]